MTQMMDAEYGKFYANSKFKCQGRHLQQPQVTGFKLL